MFGKSFLALLCSAFALVFSAQTSWAFVVQDINNALSFNNTSRTPSSVQPQPIKTPPPVVDNTPSADAGIADKLRPSEEGEDFYIDMQQKSSQTISAKPEQTFFVILPEEAASSWHFDENFKLAEVVSSELDNHRRILEFRVLCCGEGTLFLDNIIKKGSQVRVLQSKILRLRVEK